MISVSFLLIWLLCEYKRKVRARLNFFVDIYDTNYVLKNMRVIENLLLYPQLRNRQVHHDNIPKFCRNTRYSGATSTSGFQSADISYERDIAPFGFLRGVPKVAVRATKMLLFKRYEVLCYASAVSSYVSFSLPNSWTLHALPTAPQSCSKRSQNQQILARFI